MPSSPLVTLGIPSLALVALALVLGAVARAAPSYLRRVCAGAGIWLLISATLAISGALSDFEARPPRMLLLLIPTLALPLGLGLSRAGAALAEALPLWALVGFHAFRLPLELVMHQAALEGTMPAQMSFDGANFDIVTGATAIGVAALAARGRAPIALVAAWNALGTILLTTIVVIAVASLPTFAAFGAAPERLNTWVARFPFVWLPAILVASALLGHVVLWRRITRDLAKSFARGTITAR